MLNPPSLSLSPSHLKALQGEVANVQDLKSFQAIEGVIGEGVDGVLLHVEFSQAGKYLPGDGGGHGELVVGDVQNPVGRWTV